MSLIALGLIALSALMHALWNFFGKKISPTTAFFTVAFILSPLFMLPLVWPLLGLIYKLPADFWWLLLGSGVCQGWYLSSLAKAYRSGDISIVYPLARASPLIIVAVSTLILGQAESLTVTGIVGMCAIMAGSLILPMHHFRDLRLSNYVNRATLFALSAACATAGYSLFDDRAVKLMATQGLMTDGEVSLLYIWLQTLASGVLLVLIQVFSGRQRAALVSHFRYSWKACALTGCSMLLTYLLVLWSMQYVDNVSYVVAFRQLSIPIGVGLGVWLLSESAHRPKLTGVGLICIGLVTVATVDTV
ncbi:MAG: EamA family transporter [Marinobacterium sp.]|nr:EamA family transporter [Marinobacterium sp.]